MKHKYVFIVGCGRSGTTLLVSILNKHKNIRISNQTHFMGHLVRPGLRQKIQQIGDLSHDDNVYKLVDFVYSKALGRGAYWFWLQKNFDREALLQRILSSDRSDRALFSILMQIRAKDETVLGEKTPDHIWYVPTLIEWFPHAKIIQTIRDPRAVYVSEFKRRWSYGRVKQFPYRQLISVKPLFALFILLHMTFEWFYAAKLSFRYKRQYPENHFLLKFENLISEPEEQIRQLCDFIGVEFQTEMLEQKVINTGFRSEEGMPGFDKQAIDRWKDHVSPWVRAWFLLLGKRYLKKFGYTN